MTKLVLMRHGQSLGNQANLFTGWYDLDLSSKGHKSAQAAGEHLRQHGFRFDIAYSSMLQRTIHTLQHCLDALDQAWIPTYASWQLNERHYGALQGLNKTDTLKKYGAEQVQLWRRGFHTTPPPVERHSPHFPGNDPRYHALAPTNLPTAESPAMTTRRVMAFWHSTILPCLKKGQNTLIVTHGSPIRALLGHLNQLSEEDTQRLSISTGAPFVYELDEAAQPLRHYSL